MLTRRQFVLSSAAATGAAAASGLLLAAPHRAWAAGGPVNSLSPKAALAELIAGNRRFAGGATTHVDHTERREALASGQAPFAIVLSCSDSRVPPEVIFDQGLGSLFVVRVAGNFADADGIGSMQYAVSSFKSSVLLVLGHTSCGAVHSTVDNLKAGSPPVPGNIADVVNAVRPAAAAVLHKPGDVYANATAENVRQNVAKLRATKTILGTAIADAKLEIAGGIYDLKSGRVTLL